MKCNVTLTTVPSTGACTLSASHGLHHRRQNGCRANAAVGVLRQHLDNIHYKHIVLPWSNK
jgi:hypothetical protein